MKNWIAPDASRLIGAGLQLALTVLLGVGIGFFTDRRLGSSPWMLLLGGALGFSVGLYALLKEFGSSNDADRE
jgi:F0F1-type ATP synthase assembly protein I